MPSNPGMVCADLDAPFRYTPESYTIALLFNRANVTAADIPAGPPPTMSRSTMNGDWDGFDMVRRMDESIVRGWAVW